MRWLLIILLSAGALAQSGVPAMGRTSGSTGGGGGPTGFAFVTNGATGCSSTSSVTTCKNTLHVNPGTGDLLYIFVAWDSGSSQTMSVSDPNNGTWTAVTSKVNSSGGIAGFSAQIFRVNSAVSASTLVTATASATTSFISFEVLDYSHSGTVSANDGTPVLSQVTASTSTATQSGLTTTNASGLIIISCTLVTNNCTGVGAGYTSRNDANACLNWNGSSCGSTGPFSGAGQLMGDKIAGATGAQTATFTTSGATDAVLFGLSAF